MLDPLSKIPSGMRYYTGHEARLRRQIEDAVMRVFSGWAYEEISTPLIDYYALFERGMGASEAARSFRFSDSDGRMLALRPDVTSLVARAASTLFSKRERPLRLSYAAPVFFQRTLSPAEWRRENIHLGCELIGQPEGLAEIEVISIALEILQTLGFDGGTKLTINNVEIFNGIAENLGMTAEARERMRSLVDLRDSAELERFLEPYTPDRNEGRVFARLTQLAGKGEILEEARSIIDNRRSVAALDSLDSLWKTIEGLGFSDRCEIDLGDVSGLDYYTGTIFKIYVKGAGAKVGSGGRYDNLTANFGHREPAIGFVLDLGSISELVVKREHSPEFGTAPVKQVRGGNALAIFEEALEQRRQGQNIRVGDDGGANAP
jgi:ATP phosphoribosyltransferase regulatory subunit